MIFRLIVVARQTNVFAPGAWSEENFADQEQFWELFRSRVRLLSGNSYAPHGLGPGTRRANIRPVPGTPTLGSEFWEVSELENLSCQRMTFQCETPLQATVSVQLQLEPC